MTFKEKIDYIHEHPEFYLDRDGKGKGWICPICGSGSGRNGTGITESKKVKGSLTCWAGDCFGRVGDDGRRHGDLIDLISAEYNLSNRDAIKKAFEIYGLD